MATGGDNNDTRAAAQEVLLNAAAQDVQSRTVARDMFRQIGSWGLLNSVQQSLAGNAAQIAKTARESGIDMSEMLKLSPLGSQIYVQQSPQQPPPPQKTSGMAKALGIAALAAATGLGGWYAASALQRPEPEKRKPIDATIEWEIPISERGTTASTSSYGFSGSAGSSAGEDRQTDAGDPGGAAEEVRPAP